MAGVDASIPLAVSGGSTGLMQPGGGNLLTGMGSFAESQQKMLELKNYRSTLAAKQKLGQIMATSPSLEEGLAAAAADPDVSGFIPDTIQSLAATNTSMRSYSSATQAQNKDAFQTVMDVIPAAMVDPKSLPALFDAKLSTITDPRVRAAAERSGGNIVKWLSSAKDPAEYVTRATAIGMVTGSDEAMRKFWGQSGIVDKGNVKQPIITAPTVPTVIPGQVPGAVTEVGNGLTQGFSPSLVDGNAVPFREGGGGAKATGGAARNPLALPAPKTAAPKAGGGNATAPAPAPVPASSAPVSGLGTPLFDEKTDMKAPPVTVKTVAGGPAGLPGQQAAELQKKFSTEDLHVYNNAQQTRGYLAEMSHDINRMAKGGGFLSPGTAAEFRVGLARFAKTVGDITGTELDIDADKIASAEDMMKATNKMTLSYLNTALGTQREAAETIKNFSEKAMPGINNTLLGSQMLIAMASAMNDRAIDQYHWDSEFNTRNNGDLRTSAQKFNEKFPIKQYINKALEGLGMDEKGFKTRDDIERAYKAGLLTLDQANAIRLNSGKIPADLPKAE